MVNVTPTSGEQEFASQIGLFATPISEKRRKVSLKKLLQFDGYDCSRNFSEARVSLARGKQLVSLERFSFLFYSTDLMSAVLITKTIRSSRFLANLISRKRILVFKQILFNTKITMFALLMRSGLCVFKSSGLNSNFLSTKRIFIYQNFQIKNFNFNYFKTLKAEFPGLS